MFQSLSTFEESSTTVSTNVTDEALPSRKKQKKTPRLELPIVEKRLKRTYTPAARKLKTGTRVKKMLARNSKTEPEIDDTPPSEAFFNSVRMAAKWEEKKYDYVDAYFASICNGLPLKNAGDPAATPECTCSKSFLPVKCYFFFGSVFKFAIVYSLLFSSSGSKVINIPTCRCRDVAEPLLMMQMFPKTLINVKAAIHFGCLDLFDMFEPRAQVSTTVFAEIPEPNQYV
ncbi:hypothetical protein [Parasitella parasitica]|uniref:CxC1-like cysteine cluster associated with KDZ transposases domain-containing protein n=1 Tax=Parasitella parasitica TaxID=35722 RepID=A0A0B7NGN7_9FUNG|nr:hypothetical protein [Parasitella parasitica]